MSNTYQGNIMKNIAFILETQYRICSNDICQVQGGWSALAYKVKTGRGTYFLKVYEKDRASTAKWAALIDQYVPVLKWLTRSGLRGRIPLPLLTQNGDYKVEDDHGIYLLYDYIEGETVGERDLTASQVRQLSEIISYLHGFGEEISIDTTALKEDYNNSFVWELRRVLESQPDRMDSDVKEMFTYYRMPMIKWLIRLDELSVQLQKRNLKMVLCHTDIHNWNLMMSGEDLILIDWEGLKLAPAEADFMYLAQQPYYGIFLNVYQQMHKDFKIDAQALQFYQIRRRLEDIWEFTEQLTFDKQNGDDRVETLKLLKKELIHLADMADRIDVVPNFE